jgi:hypothetical protein
MEKAAQTELVPSPTSLLDESRGVISASQELIEEIGPDTRITLGRLALKLGEEIAPHAPREEHRDKALRIYRKDLYAAEPQTIETGLYIPPSDPRYRTAELLITVGDEPCELELPGVVDKRMGVVFPREEFHVVARNARDFTKHVKAKTLRANKENGDRDEVEAKTYRSAAHAMDQKIQSLGGLENKLIEDRHLLGKIFRDTRSTWRAHYKAKNLEKDRKAADELIHDTAETASINLNLGTTSINALHRAITSNLHRRGSAREITHMWQSYSRMVGRYVNARRGKVIQSRNACLKQLNVYAPYLELEVN